MLNNIKIYLKFYNRTNLLLDETYNKSVKYKRVKKWKDLTEAEAQEVYNKELAKVEAKEAEFKAMLTKAKINENDLYNIGLKQRTSIYNKINFLLNYYNHS